MKKLIRSTILICVILFNAAGAFAQTQFEAIKALGEGDYRIYDVSGKSGKYIYTFDPKTAATNFMRVTFSEPNDSRRFETKVHWGSSKMRYCADEVGYAASMIKGGVKHPKLKYLRRVSEDERMVAMEDMIFLLSDYKSPEDFRIYKVIKKGKLSKLKAMKEYVKAIKMEKMGLEEKLKAQLKKEFAAQATALPKWKSANADYYAQIKKDEATWKALMKESDKQRDKILAEQRARKARNSGGSKSGTFTFKNNTGKMLKVLGDNCCVKTLSHGSTATFKCNDRVHTVVMKGQSNERGSVICSGKNYCGKTFVYGSGR